jgi:CheY-like chemotaxis protein
MEPEPAAVARRALVLVVEQDPHMKILERYFLEQAGYRVEFAGDGELGLLAAQSSLPAIVIAEILLPRLDGINVCRRLKSDPATRHIPVLLFSILMAAERARTAGADAFLMKPLDDVLLIRTVEQLLGGSGTQERDEPAS